MKIVIFVLFLITIIFSMSRVVSSLSDEDFKGVLSVFMIFCSLILKVISNPYLNKGKF